MSFRAAAVAAMALLATMLPIVSAAPAAADASAPFRLQIKRTAGNPNFNHKYLNLIEIIPDSSLVGLTPTPKDAYSWQYNSTYSTLTTQEASNDAQPVSLQLLKGNPDGVKGLLTGYKVVDFDLGLKTPGFQKPGPVGDALVFDNSKAVPAFRNFAICPASYQIDASPTRTHSPILVWRNKASKSSAHCTDVELIISPN